MAASTRRKAQKPILTAEKTAKQVREITEETIKQVREICALPKKQFWDYIYEEAARIRAHNRQLHRERQKRKKRAQVPARDQASR